MNTPNKSKKRTGSILVTLLFLISVLAMLVATVASDSLATMKTVGLSGRDVQAKYGAYGGLELVMNQLRVNENYYNDGAPGSDISPGHGLHTGTLGTLSNIDYTVEIWNNMGNTSDWNGCGAAGNVSVPPDTVYMESRASDSTAAANVILSSLGGNAYRKKPNFDDAAFARSKLILKGGSLVDAWDSKGGWNSYDPGGGSGSGSTGGSKGGGGNVEDYKATLGTDSKAGRTARLLGTSELNGHYRIGPGVDPAKAYSPDAGLTGGTTGGGIRGGSGTTGGTTAPTYGVSTAVDALTQIKGIDPMDNTPFKVDTKSTEVPFYIAPYDPGSLQPGVTVNEKGGKYWVDTSPPKGAGYWQSTAPPPLALPPDGYESISVPNNQTLELSSGVYYFREDFDIDGGSIVLNTTSSDPAVVFIGKKATIVNARINEGGNTGALQMAFTDEIDSDPNDPATLDALATSLVPEFEFTGTPAEQLLAVKNVLAPLDDPLVPTGGREGTSMLTMSGSQFYGNISGKNMVAQIDGGDVFGATMANVILGNNTNLHQDLSLKGSKLMAAGGWELGVHQIR